jgi:hypothetical protein
MRLPLAKIPLAFEIKSKSIYEAHGCDIRTVSLLLD